MQPEGLQEMAPTHRGLEKQVPNIRMPQQSQAPLGNTQGNKEEKQKADRTEVHTRVRHILYPELMPLVTFPEEVCKLTGSLQHREMRVTRLIPESKPKATQTCPRQNTPQHQCQALSVSRSSGCSRPFLYLLLPQLLQHCKDKNREYQGWEQLQDTTEGAA